MHGHAPVSTWTTVLRILARIARCPALTRLSDETLSSRKLVLLAHLLPVLVSVRRCRLYHQHLLFRTSDYTRAEYARLFRLEADLHCY